MRVIHVAPTPFGPKGLLGGGERYPLELSRAIARLREVDCRLVTFGDRASRHIDGSGLEVQSLRARYHFRRHIAHPVAASLPGAVRGADIVHTHHLYSAPSIISALSARLSGAISVSTDHGLEGGPWAPLADRLFARHLTVSAYSARMLDFPFDKVRVIYGGVDPELFRPAPSPARDFLLFAGRLTPHKGVDVLLRALPPRARLVIVGSTGHDPKPPERDYPALLHRLASGRDVTFLGPVSDHQLAGLLGEAAAVVVPSVEETCYGRRHRISELLGLTALEAMACGTPVVASRIGGLPEVVEDGVTGLLFSAGDDGALREHLSRLLADRRLVERLGRAGAERVLDRWTWHHCAVRCLAAYKELL